MGVWLFFNTDVFCSALLEFLLSEAQEPMTLAVPVDREEVLFTFCSKNTILR